MKNITFGLIGFNFQGEGEYRGLGFSLNYGSLDVGRSKGWLLDLYLWKPIQFKNIKRMEKL